MRPKADIDDNQRLELYSLQLLLLSLLLSTRRRGSLDIFSHDVPIQGHVADDRSGSCALGVCHS